MGIRGVASPFLPFSASCRGPNETSLGPGSALGEKEEKNRRRRKKKVGERSESGEGKGWRPPFPFPAYGSARFARRYFSYLTSCLFPSLPSLVPGYNEAGVVTGLR